MKQFFNNSYPEDNIEHKVPPKPENQEEQVAMMWEAVFNGDGILKRLISNNRCLTRRLHFQDVKLNFILVFLALLLGCLGRLMFS